MKLKPQEIEKRLLEAQNQSFLALAVCIAYPLVYYALIYYFRAPLLHILDQVHPVKLAGPFISLILFAPFLVLPAVYHWLGDRIAASVGLACPECDKYITSDRDWKICLFTGRCPHCQNYIIDRSPSPEQKNV
jgi:hypothetical protein